MIMKLILFIFIMIGALSSDDISHPHAPNSMVKNLKSYSFPNGNHRTEQCKMNQQ